MSLCLKLSLIGMLMITLVTGCSQTEITETSSPTTTTNLPTTTAIPPTAIQSETSTTIPQPEATETPLELEAAPALTTRPGYFSQEELLEDSRQLAAAIEDAHPDPYILGGGKIAFHRRLFNLLNSIPEDGATKDEFIRLIRPFVAAVGDSHTEIWDDYQVNGPNPGGVPLYLNVVEESLYVTGVPTEIGNDLIGARLISVEGIPLAELSERQKRLVALENEYNVLEELMRNTLWYGPYLHDLLPEWEDDTHIDVELQLSSGGIDTYSFTLPQEMINLDTPNSQVSLPRTGDSGFRTDFLGAEGEIAYLRVDHLMNYREMMEMETGEPAPHLKSATETFRGLVVEMEAAGTDTLIIDLRGNQGGHSIMGDILVYFLYGKQALLDIELYPASIGGGMVRKYSNLFWSQTRNWISLEMVNEGRSLPLMDNDYDFIAEFNGEDEQFEEYKAIGIANAENTWFGRSPTF